MKTTYGNNKNNNKQPLFANVQVLPTKLGITNKVRAELAFSALLITDHNCCVSMDTLLSHTIVGKSCYVCVRFHSQINASTSHCSHLSENSWGNEQPLIHF